MPDPATLKAMIVVLLTWISANTGQPVPDTEIDVHFVGSAYLQRFAGIPDGLTVLGYDDEDGGIYLDDRLDLAGNVCARSVLLHELTHVFQDARHFALNAPEPVRHEFREAEAYRLQELWLRQNGVEMRRPENRVLGAFTNPGTCGRPAP